MPCAAPESRRSVACHRRAEDLDLRESCIEWPQIRGLAPTPFSSRFSSAMRVVREHAAAIANRSPKRRRIIFLQSGPQAHHPRHHYRLASGLAQAGYDVMTMAPRDLSPGQTDAVPVEYLPSRGSRLTRMLSAPLTVAAAARRRPIAVHVVSLDLLPWAVLLHRLGRCVVVYDSNDEHDSMMLIKEWLFSPIRPLLQRVVRWLEPWLAARLSAATTALPATQDKFERAGVRSVLVRNFPPASLAYTAQRGSSFDYDVLVGGSLPEDQISLLAETASRLSHLGYPETRWLVAARNYGAAECELLESTLREHGVRESFELRYNVPFAQMAQITARSRIGLLLYPMAANYESRIPLRVFEYMAWGLPFVASDLPTTAQFTREHEVAELVPAGDAAGYAAAIAGLLANPEKQVSMSTRGPVAAREHYSWEREAHKLTGLYERLVGPPLPSTEQAVSED